MKKPVVNLKLMKYDKYFDKLITLIVQQKLLFIVFAIILIMVLGVTGMSFIESDAKPLNTNGLTQSVAQNSQQPFQQSVQLPAISPSPTQTPFTTKFIYFIRGLFGQPNNSITNQNNGSSGVQNYRPGGSSAANQTSTQQQDSNNSSVSESGNSGNGGGSSGTSQGDQTGSQQGGQQASLTPASSPPPTDIQIVFVNENGEYWTYVPPDIPPIDVTWVKYINHQDHYSIEYPDGWQIVTSNYNGHEGVTLYMPGDPDNIDKPSIAFVGWNANYLTSTSKHTGQIILNGTPGTIYTNGPLGPSSIAAVFQYSNGYFALGSSTSDPIFIYVFDHMLRSLEFNI